MRRIGLVVVLLIGLPGCERLFGGDTPHFTEVTPLTEPWLALRLPVDGGKVTVSDEATVSVHHVEGATEELGNRYAAALLAGGWTKDADTSAGGIVNQTWSKEGKSLALSVLDRDGERVVSLSILPF